MTGKQLIGAEAPPAADTLDGTEVLHIVQGVNSRVTTTQDIADLAGGGGSAYIISGTYAPTMATLTGAGTIATGFGLLGRTRMGGGAGAPRAGDTVNVSGGLVIANGADGDTFSMTLPFEATPSPYPVVRITPIDDDFAGRVLAQVIDATTVRLTLDGAGTDADGGGFDVQITYQTANAVDP